MSKNPQEPSDDDMKIEEDRIDDINERATKIKISLGEDSVEKKIKLFESESSEDANEMEYTFTHCVDPDQNEKGRLYQLILIFKKIFK